MIIAIGIGINFVNNTYGTGGSSTQLHLSDVPNVNYIPTGTEVPI
jgi:hypothetical protein